MSGRLRVKVPLTTEWTQRHGAAHVAPAAESLTDVQEPHLGHTVPEEGDALISQQKSAEGVFPRKWMKGWPGRDGG